MMIYNYHREGSLRLSNQFKALPRGKKEKKELQSSVFVGRRTLSSGKKGRVLPQLLTPTELKDN